ncbi:MAG: asparaginase domain-containing protein, partial [Bacteroidota bacterium]
TGGTIDKDYPRSSKGWAFEIGEAASLRILKKLNPSFDYELVSLLKKDSLEISEADRKMLLEYCQKSPYQYIVITHGTDTLIETALFLKNISEKTVVLTGAMRPEQFSNSDAPIQLGIAIGGVQSLPPGVYVAMHGRIASPQQMQRDVQSGKFYPDPKFK